MAKIKKVSIQETKKAAPSDKDEVLFSEPLFAKFLESQRNQPLGTNKKNDDIDTPKYPYDNSDITNVNPSMQVLGIQTTNKKTDTIYQTLKYPSDRDEYVTLKYPSDADESHMEHKDYSLENKEKNAISIAEKATQKWPSEEDDTTEYPQDMEKWMSNKPMVKPPKATKPTYDYVQTMKYPSDGDEPTSKTWDGPGGYL